VLAAIPRRICVASGRHRVRGLVGAIAAGVVSELILDEDTATELLRHLTDPAPRTPPSAAAAR
jgi:deoxyribonucleoside regulator